MTNILYNLIERQIDIKEKFNAEEYEELRNKIDIFLLGNRLSEDEYNTLVKALDAKKEEIA